MIALVQFLSRMGELMSSEIAFVSKRSRTAWMITLVRFLSRMGELMVSESAR